MDCSHNFHLDRLLVASHSQQVVPGGTFVAISGAKQNGVLFIPDALSRGASTIVVQDDAIISQEIVQQIKEKNAKIERVADIRAALGEYAARAYGYPAKKLKIIGITGTKGKSTTSFLLEHILRTAGYKTALISTVYNKILDQKLPVTGMTTPLPDYLHAFFAQCVLAGVEYVVCEAAAQAFSMRRFVDINFCAGIFTNFSQEHGEFYATMDQYFSAKKEIINHLNPGAPLCCNVDDAAVAALQNQYPFCVPFTFSAGSADCPALVGQFNQYNIAAAITCVQALVPISLPTIEHALKTFAGVPGRLNRYMIKNNSQVFIDYAHNPSSYEAVLGALRPLTDNLIVVFGCGGDRDRSKRPIMGSIAAYWADVLIVTSDNPRSENPEVIAEDICAGLTEKQREKTTIILDRKKAIEYAVEHKALPGSIIALLGKGPEGYQIIGSVKHPFSEAAIIQSFI